MALSAMTVATRWGMAVSRDAGRVRAVISMSGGVGGLEAEKGFLYHGTPCGALVCACPLRRQGIAVRLDVTPTPRKSIL